MAKPRFLTYAECAAWCQAHDYPVVIDSHGRSSPALRSLFDIEPLQFPVDGQVVESLETYRSWGLDLDEGSEDEVSANPTFGTLEPVEPLEPF